MTGSYLKLYSYKQSMTTVTIVTEAESEAKSIETYRPQMGVLRIFLSDTVIS